MTSGLVNASFSLPEWQAVKMIFFAPWPLFWFKIFNNMGILKESCCCSYVCLYFTQRKCWVVLSSKDMNKLKITVIDVNVRLVKKKKKKYNFPLFFAGILAMSCINELLSKNCVPVEFEEFLLKLFQQTFQLLQRITKDTGAQAVENMLTEQDEG